MCTPTWRVALCLWGNAKSWCVNAWCDDKFAKYITIIHCSTTSKLWNPPCLRLSLFCLMSYFVPNNTLFQMGDVYIVLHYIQLNLAMDEKLCDKNCEYFFHKYISNTIIIVYIYVYFKYDTFHLYYNIVYLQNCIKNRIWINLNPLLASLFVSFLHIDMTQVVEIRPIQYRRCWCPGDAWSQGISNHDTDYVEPNWQGTVLKTWV